LIEITQGTISPQVVVNQAKTNGSGCVVTYVGVIRDRSENKPVLSVEYRDIDGGARSRLQQIADDARKKWPLENVAITHRIGKLNVGEINLVIAVASAHRQEGFAACQYIIDHFKQTLPTQKLETYRETATSEDAVKEIEQKIADLKARWPPHSVPGRMYQELEDLEDQLEKAKRAKQGDRSQ
jgi:molybdopterin synthase catalytic subunit